MSAEPHISDEQIAEVIERVADGLSLKAACVEAGFAYWNIIRRIRGNDVLKQLDARAREDYQRVRVDEMAEIAKAEPDVQRARLICDNIKWEAARVARKIFGEQVDHKHAGSVGFVLYGERESESTAAWQAQHSQPQK